MKQYQILMVDPPWSKRKGGKRAVRPNQGRELDYQTMPTSDIFSLMVRQILPLAAPEHCVFLWMVDEFLEVGEEWMHLLGYRRHARIIWDKENGVAPAFSIRYTHEYLVWYYKGCFPPCSSPGVFPTVIREKSREHSRKPDAAYKMIESLYPGSPKIDVFSREKRLGWDQFGNQTNHFTSNFKLNPLPEATNPLG